MGGQFGNCAIILLTNAVLLSPVLNLLCSSDGGMSFYWLQLPNLVNITSFVLSRDGNGYAFTADVKSDGGAEVRESQQLIVNYFSGHMAAKKSGKLFCGQEKV